MVQDQLVDYISSQMKLGVSRDAVKSTLVSAGWVPADVEDTLKKVEGIALPAAAAAVQPAKPIGVSSPAATSFFGGNANVAAKSPMRPNEPQTIRVSDLISASPLSTKDSPKSNANSMRAASPMPRQPQTSRHGSMLTIILSIIIIIFAALAGYFFWQNNNLASQVSGVNATSQSVTAQISSLQSRVTSLDASNTALMAQVASLTATDQALATNLSLLVVAPGVGPSALSPTIVLNGLLSGGKPTYVLTTNYGVRVSIKNSADANVRMALQPFVLTTSTVVQLGGTYVPGSSAMTVASVNGAPIAAPATATSTP